MGFKTAHAFVSRWEGFISGEDGHDPGGLTKWGISLRALVGLGLDFNNDGASNRLDILAMTPEQSRDIYLREYWIAAACPRLPPPLALLMYDCAVNQGVSRASRILQKCCRVKVDGIIGRKTLAAVKDEWAQRPTWLLTEFCARRAVHYSSLSLVVRYGLGWFRRLFDAHSTALALHLEGEDR